MRSPAMSLIGLGVVVSAAAGADVGPRQAVELRVRHTQAFFDAHVGAAISRDESGTVRRVFGRGFSHGESALESAERFRMVHAGIFGVRPEDLKSVATPDGGLGQPVLYQPETGTSRFTVFAYEQRVGDLAVHDAALRLLVRNDPGNPLVLASSTLRDLGGFVPDPAAVLAPLNEAGRQAAIGRAEVIVGEAGGFIIATDRVIFAGVDGEIMAPRVADASIVGVGNVEKWLIITDAGTGALLHEETLVHVIDISGSTSGIGTEGMASDACAAEIPKAVPYARVTGPDEAVFSDAEGNFLLPNNGSGNTSLNAILWGIWFKVNNIAGSDLQVNLNVNPPGPASILFNPNNNNGEVRAQVNAYIEANLIRDFTLEFNPKYPTLEGGEFAVNVNRSDGFCPGNAWYDPNPVSMNFCLPGGSSPNTAYSSVVYHEYGHHLVNVGGSGQGQYGEGMGDVMSVLIGDDPILGLGFSGDCATGLRNADNTMQYPCSGEFHFCGTLLSGAVWSIRNELVLSETQNYIDVLAGLAINSILLHTGNLITPGIAIDYLTLDDDDADICNGTPHFAEISTGFDAHNLFASSLSFTFPNGVPDMLDPGVPTVIAVDIACVGVPPSPGTGMLHLDTGDGFNTIPMEEVSSNSYEATIPAALCGTPVSYYFSIQTQAGFQVTEPAEAPSNAFNAIVANSIEVVFQDSFNSNLGWTVTGDASDGQWERGAPIPISTCDRGNPGSDADATLAAYLTDNSSANNCNSDVDNGSTILTSPLLEASSGDPTIAYWRWFDNTGNSEQEDVFVVEVSSDNGANWVGLETVGPGGPEAAGGWNFVSFRIADFVPLSSEFQIRFIATDNSPGSIVEAGIDGVQMTNLFCGSCVADCGDGDGVVSVVDLLALLAQWNTPDACDLDGANVGITDLLVLLGAWGPCP